MKSYDTPPRTTERAGQESLIAQDLTIEGKIEGAGDIRIAGRFNGDVHVKGNLTIERGAKLTGGVRAAMVTIGGELEGNIEAASRVELLDSGVLSGDLKAASFIVAAGSRMRGQVEFGWEDRPAPSAVRKDSGLASSGSVGASSGSVGASSSSVGASVGARKESDGAA